jgi:hypothetical protein
MLYRRILNLVCVQCVCAPLSAGRWEARARPVHPATRGHSSSGTSCSPSKLGATLPDVRRGDER